MSAHTPGPWVASCAPFDMAVAALREGSAMDIMGARGVLNYESEANIVLAAAAPDLLAALQAQQEAEDWMASADETDPFFEETCRLKLNHAADLRIDAIAKAAGKEDA